jgi:hypothetical protein
MDYSFFNHTLDMGAPPEDFSDELKALWWERKNYWDKAHEIVQHLPGNDAAWVHAYLHRKEGDQMNASYWYKNAGKTMPDSELNEEFREITKYLLEKYSQ